MKMNNIIGLENIKSAITNIIKNKKIYQCVNALPPHMLFAGLGSGDGCSMLANTITDEYFENNIRPFTALDLILEFKPNGKTKDSLNEVIADIQTASTYKNPNHYEGNIFINLDNILPYANDSHVTDFLYDLTEVCKYATLFFFLDTSKRGADAFIEKIKSIIIGISVIEVAPYSINDLLSITKQMIENHGIDIKDDVDSIITNLISEYNIKHAKECVYLTNDLIKYADITKKTPSLSAKELNIKSEAKGVTTI